MNTITIENITYNYNCYGSNLEISRDGLDGLTEYRTTIYSDSFCPNTEEFDENWNVVQYIEEYISLYCDIDEIPAEVFEKALWSSTMRYMADDAFSQWEEDNL